MNYNLLNGAFEAKLPGLTKLVLLGMLWHRNDQTGRVWVSQETLATELGISYNTVARAIDKLEQLKVLVYVGELPLRPGCTGRSTHIYEIDLKPLGFVPSQVTNPSIDALSGHQSGDWSPLRVPKDKQSVVGVGSGGGTESVASVINRTGTVPFGEPSSTSSKVPSQTQPPHPQGLRPRTPAGTSRPETHGTEGKTVAPLHSEIVPPRQPFTDDEVNDLCLVLSRAAFDAGMENVPIDDEDFTAALRGYDGPYTSAQLALFMLWAFKFSKGPSGYWYKPEAWTCGLSMENFLAVAPTLDKQFSKWRQRPGLEKKFSTLQSASDFVFGVKSETKVKVKPWYRFCFKSPNEKGSCELDFFGNCKHCGEPKDADATSVVGKAFEIEE